MFTKRFLIGLVVLLLLAEAGYLWWSWSRPEEQTAVMFTPCPVERGTFILDIPITGRLVARDKQEVFPPFYGTVLTLADEGSMAKPDDIVCTVDAREYEDALYQLELEEGEHEASLQLKKLDHDLKAFRLKNRVTFAEYGLEVAELNLDSLLHGLDASAYTRTVFKIRNIENKITVLGKEIDEKRKHLESGFVSREELTMVELEQKTEKLKLEAAERDLKLLKKGAGEDQVESARRDVKLRKHDLEEARKRLEAFETDRVNELEEVQSRLDFSRKQIDYYREMIQKAEVPATIEGVIIYGDTWVTWGQMEKVKPGSPVRRGTSFMEVSSLGAMQIETWVSEVDVSRIETGMEVSFKLEAYPETQYRGTVSEIGKIAEFESGGFDTGGIGKAKNVKVLMDVSSTEAKFKPNMTVFARIILKRRENAVMVPTGVIFEDDSVRLEDGSVISIVTGPSNYTHTVVEKGLTGDETILKSTGVVTAAMLENKEAFRVERKPLLVSVKDIGELQPAEYHNISVEGRGKINEMIDEGTVVKKDDQVAVIDAKDYQDRLEERELELKGFETDRKLIEKEADSALYKLKQEIEIAAHNLEIAKIEQQKLLRGGTGQERRDHGYAIELAVNKVDQVKRELELKRTLLKEGVVSAQEISDLTMQLGAAEADHEVAKVKYDLLVQGGTSNQRRKAEISLLKDELNHQLAQQEYDNKLEKKEIELKKNQYQIDSKIKDVDELKRMIEQYTVKSPCDGTTVYMKSWKNNGLYKIEEGDKVYPYMGFLKIANLDRFIIQGEVPEASVGQFKQGQEVAFNLTSDKAKKYIGTLESIGYFAKQRSSGTGLDKFVGGGDENAGKVFEVTIATAERSKKFQPGMTVEFDIVIEKHENMLCVPLTAVFYDERGSFVYTVGTTSGATSGGEKRYVTLGPKNKEQAAVTEGLNEGDEIWNRTD